MNDAYLQSQNQEALSDLHRHQHWDRQQAPFQEFSQPYSLVDEIVPYATSLDSGQHMPAPALYADRKIRQYLDHNRNRYHVRLVAALANNRHCSWPSGLERASMVLTNNLSGTIRCRNNISLTTTKCRHLNLSMARSNACTYARTMIGSP